MPSQNRPEWEVRVHGKQRKTIDVGLVAQIVLMLGRALKEQANETQEGGDYESNNTEQHDGSSGRKPAA